MTTQYQLPLNALGIKILAVMKGKLFFTPDGDFADENTGEVLVTVSAKGFNITLEGARIIMRNIVDLELSHREFAIIKELVKPRKARSTETVKEHNTEDPTEVLTAEEMEIMADVA